MTVLRKSQIVLLIHYIFNHLSTEQRWASSQGCQCEFQYSSPWPTAYWGTFSRLLDIHSPQGFHLHWNHCVRRQFSSLIKKTWTPQLNGIPHRKRERLWSLEVPSLGLHVLGQCSLPKCCPPAARATACSHTIRLIASARLFSLQSKHCTASISLQRSNRLQLLYQRRCNENSSTSNCDLN